jgi:hypothetical protein
MRAAARLISTRSRWSLDIVKTSRSFGLATEEKNIGRPTRLMDADVAKGPSFNANMAISNELVGCRLVSQRTTHWQCRMPQALCFLCDLAPLREIVCGGRAIPRCLPYFDHKVSLRPETLGLRGVKKYRRVCHLGRATCFGTESGSRNQ